jgi:asparagine synthase (glutamine-hydrolysing)
MSGIFGIYNLGGEPAAEKYLLKMREKTAQYGRDGQDIFIDGNIGLGCCMSKFGANSQADVPVYTDKRQEMTLVCDALVWNRAELLDQLGLETDAATQALLLEAYQKWGADCPKYINGDFALAIWENEKKQLFIARDHLGIRPLYYFFDGSAFAFATDYRALLALSFVGKQLDEVRLYALLSNTYHIDPEATYFEHIKRLPQAHALCAGHSGLRKSKYWSPGVSGKVICNTEEEYAQTLYGLVADAVKLRVHGVSGQIGAELSGGLDSSVITILANREFAKTGGKLQPLYSWSPSWELLDQRPQDERELIEAVCRQEGLSCTYDDPDDPLYADMNILPLPEALGSWEIMWRELKLMSSRGAGYILSGWGGDDAASLRTGLYQILLEGYAGYFLRQAWWLAKGSPLRFIKVMAANTILQWFRPGSYFGNPNKNVPDIINREFGKKMKKLCKKDLFYFSVDPKRSIQSGMIQTRTEVSAWLDAEYNFQHLYPLLDYRVVNFALSVPRHLYYKQGVNRYVFRKAFADILPPEFGGYFIKDDPAKTEFLRGRHSADRLKEAIGLLDRGRFEPYIDWDKLEKAADACRTENGFKSYVITRKKIRACLGIGRVIGGTDG